MGIFQYLRPRAIRSVWSYKARGAIWRLLFSESGYVVGEDRNEQERTLNYFCLESSTGKPVWEEKKFGQEWWTGIQAIDGNTLYLHGFATPEMPELKGIIAVDIPSGNILWENQDVKLVSAKNGQVIASRNYFEREASYYLDPETGNIKTEIYDEAFKKNIPFVVADSDHYKFPWPVVAGDAIHMMMRLHVPQEGIVGTVDALGKNNYILFHYYERKDNSVSGQGSLENIFKILNNKNGKFVFSEILLDDAKYPVPDSFFFHNETLYYIKNRSILTAVSLP